MMLLASEAIDLARSAAGIAADRPRPPTPAVLQVVLQRGFRQDSGGPQLKSSFLEARNCRIGAGGKASVPVQSISIRVDGKTFRRWTSSMNALRAIYTLPVVAVGSVSGLPPLRQTVKFSGIRLLGEIGLAASRPDMLHNPARHFAVLKYATSLSSCAEFLLHQSIPRVDQHKRKVLSDDFGAGFSFVAARPLLGATFFLDLKTAILKGKVVRKRGGTQEPDYVALLPGNELALVEAKGTQTRYYAKRQVKAGCDQLKPWKAGRIGYPIKYRAAIGIELGINGRPGTSKLFVGDPDEAPDSEPLDLGEDSRDTIVRDHFARAAAFSGDTELLARLDADGASVDEAGELEHEQILGRTFVGSRLRISCGASEAILFVGIDEEVRGRAVEGSVHAAADEALARAASRRASRGDLEKQWSEVELEGGILPNPSSEPSRGESLGRDLHHHEPVPTAPTAVKAPGLGVADPGIPAVAESDDGTVVQLVFHGPIVNELRS